MWCTIQTVILWENKSLGEESGKEKKGNGITLSCFFGAQKNTRTLSGNLGETVLKHLTNQFLMTVPFSYLWQNDYWKKLEDKARSFTKAKKIMTERKWEPCTVTVKSSKEEFLIPISTPLPPVRKEKGAGSVKGTKCCKPIFTSERTMFLNSCDKITT